MPAPASLAIKPCCILSRLCEACASLRRHLSMARHIISRSFRLVALCVNHARRKRKKMNPGSREVSGTPAVHPQGWTRSQPSLPGDFKMQQPASVGRGSKSPNSSTCAWYFNHLHLLLQLNNPQPDNRANS